MNPLPNRPLRHGAPRVSMPRGRYFVLTWSIPNDYGGMTSALLHRSRAFVRLGGVSVDVVTFDSRVDYPELEERMRASGDLVDGLRLLNLWDWLRGNAPTSSWRGSLDLDRHPFSPLSERDASTAGIRTTSDGVEHVLTRTRWDAAGSHILQVDHFRMDGSLLASDRRDCRERGTPGGRSLVLCDAAGRPVRSWGGTWPLYRFWLDQIAAPGQGPAFMIVDSKTVATFMLTYHRPHAVTAHVVHSSHLAGNERPIAPLRPSRRAVFEKLDGFDAVVVLTRRQKNDVLVRSAALGATDGDAPYRPPRNLAVIPNSRDIAGAAPARTSRRVGDGMVLASLTSRKRVDHAVQAIAQARRALVADGGMPPGLSLDIYGDGDLRGELASLVSDAGAGDYIHFHGHVPDARARLDTASFLLLTATSEGFPLVLVEAMSAGCIPIAYDIPYGPADIIRHGHNGFLVEAGNVAALAEAVLSLLRSPARTTDSMRASARRTAARYTDDRVTRLWARELARAAHRKAGRPVAPASVRAVLRLGRKAIRRIRTAAG